MVPGQLPAGRCFGGVAGFPKAAEGLPAPLQTIGGTDPDPLEHGGNRSFRDGS